MGDDARTPNRILVRPFAVEDWSTVWAIIHDVATRAETFAYEPVMSEDEARRVWITPPPGRVVVAVDPDAERVLGTANMYANRPGPVATWPRAASWSQRMPAGVGWDGP
jgi:hypothetical protein